MNYKKSFQKNMNRYPRRDWMPGNTPELSPFNINYSSVSPIITYGYPLPIPSKQGGYGPVQYPEFPFAEPMIYPFDEFEYQQHPPNIFILPHTPRIRTGRYETCFLSNC